MFGKLWALRLIGLLSASMLLASCHGRERSFELDLDSLDDAEDMQDLAGGTARVAVFDLSHGAPESQESGGLFARPASDTFVGLIRSVLKSRDDADVTAVLVRLGEINFGWARSEELGRHLFGLREAKKPVVCHAHSLTNTTAWLALRGCDRIWLSEAGEVSSVGLAAELVYFKAALDKLKVRADFLHVGKFKSGVEPFTREGPSEASRKDLTETLAAIRKVWLESAQDARKGRDVKQALEHGPWTAEQAQAWGLVDALGTESDALKDAKQRGKTLATASRFGPGSSGSDGFQFAEVVRVLAGADDRSEGRPHLAVVPAVGAISMDSGAAFGSTSGITAKALVKTLHRLKSADSVKAVVLRLDSPGGSPLASDLIWQAVTELRKKKPVIVSVGEMAASGGYYLASAASRIVADRTSIVGSIGVFGGKLVVGEALEGLGVHAVTVAASQEPGAADRATYMSPFKPWDERSRKRARQQMQSVYDLFVKRVADGRKLKKAEVEANAQGRIFSGVAAKQRRLIDELGGLDKALSLGRKLGHLDSDAPVVVEGLAEGLLEMLFGGAEAQPGEVKQALADLQERRARFAEWIPVELQPFVSSLAPLIQGEHTVAALPFALLLR